MAASGAPCTSGRYDPDLWWPLSERSTMQIAQATALCSICPIRAECLLGALRRQERDGIWGGTVPSERLQHTEVLRRDALRELAETEDGQRTSLVAGAA